LLLKRVLYRRDRVRRPRATVPVAAIRHDDGWCDAVGDRNYNRMVRYPYPASAEQLWRDDMLYDVVVVLRYNELPRIKGCGSAIFLHVARPDGMPTQGCIGLKRADLERVLARLKRGAAVRVTAR
jgi:L,D-peptidoglycan transpeptidase YkuD (ErfK/YbiS/YcfS/YnhG family)